MYRGKSKSAGATPRAAEDLRSVCRRISPYVVHGWRDVCEELGVADDDVTTLERRLAGSRLSEVAFKGLCCWVDQAGKLASRDKLLRALQLCGMRRAQGGHFEQAIEKISVFSQPIYQQIDELRSISRGRSVPFLGRPATAVPLQDCGMNKQARQKALADRLSRPRKADNKQPGGKHKTPVTASMAPGTNPLALQISPSKESDICEVKIKLTVQGVRRTEDGEIESTKDDFHSTKDDFKHTCHTFLKLVMTNQATHFKELKELLGFSGISLQRLEKMGFNINLYILCFNLGALEVLYQSYSTGRLKKIVHGTLVIEDYLQKLNAKDLELSVVIEEGMINKYRDILVVRGASTPLDYHPIDMISVPDTDANGKGNNRKESPPLKPLDFNLKFWRQELYAEIEVLQERFLTFNENSNELLIILRIAKPPGSNVIECLQGVMDIYQSLRNSKSVSSEARIALIAEYMAIVNQIRLRTEFIRNHDLQISFDETLQEEACSDFHSELFEIEDMLRPDFQFKAEEKLIAHALSMDEKETYGGMFAYIPILLHKLHNICDILSRTIEKSSQEEKVKSEVTTDENANITEIGDANATESVKKEDNVQTTGPS